MTTYPLRQLGWTWKARRSVTEVQQRKTDAPRLHLHTDTVRSFPCCSWVGVGVRRAGRSWGRSLSRAFSPLAPSPVTFWRSSPAGDKRSLLSANAMSSSSVFWKTEQICYTQHMETARNVLKVRGKFYPCYCVPRIFPFWF